MKGFDAFITFCYTRDLNETADFYGNLLEMPLVLDQGGCRIYRVAQAGYIGVCRQCDAEDPKGLILTLVTDDVDGWFEKLEAAGTEVEKSPAYNQEYGIYHCFLRDPAGYRVEIQKFVNPDWDGREGEPT
jgi:catechol 2,3-dioxygenase-like lactoylglutathione lyase family enzyme